MKQRLRISVQLLLSVFLACLCSYYAAAVTESSNTVGEPEDIYQEPTYSDSSVESQTEPLQPEPLPDSSTAGDDDYSQPDSSGQTSSYNDYNDYNDYDDYYDDSYQNNFSFVEPSPDGYSTSSDDGYADYNNDGSVSSAPNELYDVSKSVDTNELDASDWEMALDFSGSMDGTNDFNFIKNNKSADDETTFQWMLYLGVAMIVGAVIGVICVVFTCINKRRKMLAAASGGRRGRLQGKAPSKTIYQPKKNKLQKYDTAEIDIDLGADRKDR